MALGYKETMIKWAAADATTTEYTIGSLGFTPKAVMVVCMGFQSDTSGSSGGVDWRNSIGFANVDGTRRCVSSFSADGTAAADCGSMLRNDAVLATINGSGALTGALDIAFDADAVRLIVDDTAPVDLSVLVKIWGGTDLSVYAVGDIAEPSATGNQDYTATGMSSGANADQVALFAGVQSVSAANTGEAQDSGICFGMAHDNGQWVGCVNSDDGSLSSDTDHYNISGGCIAQIVVAGGQPNARASFVQWNANGFRLNWAERALTNRRSIFLAMKGGQWTVGETTIDATTASATATVSGLAFAPAGILLFNCTGAEEASDTSATLAAWSIGGGTSTSDRRCLMCRDDNGAADMQIWTTVRDDCALGMQNNSAGTRERFDINAMNSDGFQLIVDQNNAGDSTTWWIGYAAFASAASGQSYTRTATDTLAVVDSSPLSRMRGFNSQDSVASVADSTARVVIRGRGPTDTIGSIVDSTLRVVIRGRAGLDQLTISDQMQRYIWRGATLSETIALADTLATTTRRYRLLTESVTPVVDSTGRVVTRGRAATDNITLVVDTMTRILYRGRVAEEALTLVDTAPLSRFRGDVFTETLTLSDQPVIGRMRGRVTSEAVVVTDSAAAQRIYMRLGTEGVNLTDQAVRVVIRGRAATEGLVVFDQALCSRLRGSVLSEGVSPVDTAPRSILRGRVTSETIAVADSILALSRLRGRVLSETLTVTDQLATSRLVTRLFTDALVLIDQILTSIQTTTNIRTVLASEFLTVTDISPRTIIRGRVNSEQLVLFDIAPTSTYRARLLSELIDINDSQMHGIIRGRLFGESLTIDDFAVRMLARLAVLSEQVYVDDQFQHYLIRGRALFELLEITDSALTSILHLADTLVDVRIHLGEDRLVIALGSAQSAVMVGYDTVATLGSDDPVVGCDETFIKLGGY